MSSEGFNPYAGYCASNPPAQTTETVKKESGVVTDPNPVQDSNPQFYYTFNNPNTYRVSCRQKIQLYYDYTISLQTFQPDTLNDPLYALVQSFVQQPAQSGYGYTQAQIIAQALVIAPQFSESELTTAFTNGKKRGLWCNTVPPIINWFSTPPENLFVLSADMDRNRRNSPYVQYLLILLGGYYHQNFSQYFIPKPALACTSCSSLQVC